MAPRRGLLQLDSSNAWSPRRYVEPCAIMYRTWDSDPIVMHVISEDDKKVIAEQPNVQHVQIKF